MPGLSQLNLRLDYPPGVSYVMRRSSPGSLCRAQAIDLMSAGKQRITAAPLKAPMARSPDEG